VETGKVIGPDSVEKNQIEEGRASALESSPVSLLLGLDDRCPVVLVRLNFLGRVVFGGFFLLIVLVFGFFALVAHGGSLRSNRAFDSCL
jgi:hypothetical protein